MKQSIFRKCQQIFPDWQRLSISDFTFADPKGFSSFTMAIQCQKRATPTAVLYRQLEGKENAILDFQTEKEVFLLLGEHNIAAHCYHYDDSCRIEAFYEGRTLEADDLSDPDNLRQIADALYRFHQLKPANLPTDTFFERLPQKWGPLARWLLIDQKEKFPAEEQHLCDELQEIFSPATQAKVKQCLPTGTPVFCHNDTYHGNIMKLTNGDIKLLDFEFSCLNYPAFDFANLFAETVMQHKQPDYPYFRIAEPSYTADDIATLIHFYLANDPHASNATFEKLLTDTQNMIMLSDYMYAMAALPLALEPIQKIRFLPYAQQRFARFLKAYNLKLDHGFFA